MADIFMNWFIDKAQSQSNCSFNAMLMICFVVRSSHENIDVVFQIFDFTYNNIAFTKEFLKNIIFPFLVTLIWTEKNINISVYGKPTHTGL